MTSSRSGRFSRCAKCDETACLQAVGEREMRFCLLHWYVIGGSLEQKWRVVNRAAVEAQKASVDAAYQQGIDQAASQLAASAAARIMTVEENDDPLAILIDDSKRRINRHVPPVDPRRRLRRRPIQSAATTEAIGGGDPVCSRKRTKSTPMWATTPKQGRTGSNATIDDQEDTLPRGDPCPRCDGTSTIVQPRGGGNVHAGKVETWGRKDAPDALYETTCLDCNHVWQHTD